MNDKKLDTTKLRGWAKEAQKRIEALERAQASLRVDRPEDYKYSPVPRHPIPLKDRDEFYKRRDRLRQVQIWTSAGKDKDGNHMLCSLDWPTSVPAISVYLATHDVDNLEPFDEWLAEILEVEHDQE